MSNGIHKLSNSDKGVEIAKVALNGLDSAQNTATLIFKIFGWVLIVSGGLLCITIIGLPIGIMLILLGAGMIYFYPKFSSAMKGKTVEPMLNILNDKEPNPESKTQIIDESLNNNTNIEVSKTDTETK